MTRLLIADEWAIIRKVGSRILTDLDFMVSEASSTAEATSMCEAAMPDVIIVDSSIDGALDFIASVRGMSGGDQVKIYFSIIESDLKVMMAGKRAGADDFLMKPFDRAILSATFGRLAVAA